MKVIGTTISIFVLLAFFVTPKAVAMDIATTDTNPYSLHMEGKIEKGDYENIIKKIHNKGSFPFLVFISSPGGDVIEAMRIGRFLRETLSNMYAVNECASACVLIWLAGVERDASGLFGLHRPVYSKDYFAGLSSSEASDKYRELDKYVRAYLIEMNTPTSVIDRMMVTKSSDVDFMPSEELLKIVGSNSPAYQEWIIAKCGELSASEQRDYSATIAIGLIEELTKRLGTSEEKENYKNIIAMNKDKEKYALTLSAGYRDYLTKKMREISTCTQNSANSVRQKILSNK